MTSRTRVVLHEGVMYVRLDGQEVGSYRYVVGTFADGHAAYRPTPELVQAIGVADEPVGCHRVDEVVREAVGRLASLP